MGINIHNFKHFCSLLKEKSFYKSILTLSRYDFFVSYNDLIQLAVHEGVDLRIDQKYLADRYVIPELVFRGLGFETIDSCDRSNYEGATIKHDLNEPFPDSMQEKYDVVFGFNVYDIYKNSISITDKVLTDAAGAKYEDRYRAVVTNESLYYEEKPTSLSIPPILKRTLAIPLAEAQKYKGKIKWALIVKLGPEIIGTLSKYSYIDRYETHNRYFVKVINLPTDKEKLLYGIQLIIIHNIFVNLESIWLYNDLDGKIIEKINIDEEMKSKIK